MYGPGVVRTNRSGGTADEAVQDGEDRLLDSNDHLVGDAGCECVVADATNKAGTAELTMMFGSGGLITYTAGRLLVMWSEAMKRLLPAASDAKEKS